MRITDNMRLALARAGQSNASNQVFRLSNQASTGLRVTAPSDDATAYAASVRLTALDKQIAGRATSCSRSVEDLTAAENALAQGEDVLQNAREIATAMANGATDAASRKSAATQIRQLKEALLATATTRSSKGYVFGGTLTDTAPFVKDPTTGVVSFVGNDVRTEVEVAEGVTTRSNASGAQAFTTAGSEGRDVFADLDAIATAMDNNDIPTIRNGLEILDRGHRQLVAARTDTGLALDRVQTASDLLKASQTTIQSARAKEVEADSFKTLSDLATAQNAFSQSLEITKQALAMSSLNK